MLVLRRKPGEAVIIDASITVTLLEITGERIKLGFSAPPGGSILREELLRRPRPAPSGEPASPPAPQATRSAHGPRP